MGDGYGRFRKKSMGYRESLGGRRGEQGRKEAVRLMRN